MLLFRVVGHVAVVCLPGKNSTGIKGNVINIQKDLHEFEDFVETMPRRVEDSPIFLIVHQYV
jgi:hypothetical protein